MKKLICLLTSLVGVLAVSGAQADNFYAGAFGGFNWLQSNQHHEHARWGFIAGVDLGYKWCNGFRAELEAAYRNNRIHPGESRRHTQNYAGLVNVLYDFDALGCYCATPYIGGGVGFASEKRRRVNDELSVPESYDHRRTNFAWQLIGGVLVPLNDCVDVNLAYRFFVVTHNNANNHALTVGATYNF
ncbi:MAG: porin family protein [Chlamydiia bacterium]|nr:porin family protein [Chlamydiia bacterium]